MLFLQNAAVAILVLCTIGIRLAPAAERGRERVLIGVSSKSIGFFDPDQATALESYNIYVPLIVENVRVSAAGVKAVLESEDAANVSWEQVADPSLVEEVLKKK